MLFLSLLFSLFVSFHPVRMYHTITVPYVTMFNELIDTRINSIEESVSNESWRNPVPYPQQSNDIFLSSSGVDQQQHYQPQQQQTRSRSNSQQSYDTSSSARHRTYSNNNCCDPTTISIVDAFAVPIPEEDVEIIPLIADSIQ